MKKRCRFCYKDVEEDFCKDIFNNNQSNPSISEIIETLTNVKVVESDPYTKLSCDNCFHLIILFYHFRKSVLQTNRLLIEDKIHSTNNNNQNVYNKGLSLALDSNGQIILIDNHCGDRSHVTSHHEGDSTELDRNIDENNQCSNNETEQSQENSFWIEEYNKEVVSFLKEELDIDESCLKIENDSDSKDQQMNENRENESNFEEFTFIIEKDSVTKEQKINENNQCSYTSFGDNNETICSDNIISHDDDDDSFKQCLDIIENVSNFEEFTSAIDDDSNESQELQTDKSFSNQLCDNDDDNNSKRLINNNIDKGKKQLNQRKIYKKTSTKSNSHVDLKIPLDKKPHECNICNKKYSSKADLKRHLLIHTSKKLYQCIHCNKGFLLIKDLKIHLVKHTGTKFEWLKKCSFA